MNSVHIPITIVDGFFDNPDTVRKFALEQEYFKDSDGQWPGKRSKNIHELSEPLARYIIQRLIAFFYDDDLEYEVDANIWFQIVDSKYKTGWVHNDSSILAAVIYLTPESTSGTSFYTKSNPVVYHDSTFNNYKRESIISEGSVDSSEQRIKHNSEYTETVHVKGIYNRAIFFDGIQHHCAHDFFGETNDSSRLTLVVFFKNIFIRNYFPIVRSRNTQHKLGTVI